MSFKSEMKKKSFIVDEMESDATATGDQSLLCKSKKSSASWSEKTLELVKSLDTFSHGPTKDKCVPFILHDVQIGLITPDVVKHMESYSDVFIVAKDLLSSQVKFVTMALSLTDRKTRSQKFLCVLRDWKDRNLFTTLKGWRNETYPVKAGFTSEPFLDVERSACCLFGIRTYGVHINGYVRNDSGDVYMWIARRSENKETYPGKLDNTVAGGITSDLSIMETVVKECKEEAGISEKLSSLSRPAGAISYFHENDLGLHPETEFVFDLELPRSFEPTNTDGEVSDFYLLPLKEVKELIATNEFKPNSALVLLDFFIRHGAIDPDTEPNYLEFIQGCRCPLPY